MICISLFKDLYRALLRLYETTSIFLCSLIILSYMTDFVIECYECTNPPEVSKGDECDSDRLITCPRSYDRCMTMKYTMSVGQSGPVYVEQRGCSNIASCDPKNSKCNNRILYCFLCWYPDTSSRPPIVNAVLKDPSRPPPFSMTSKLLIQHGEAVFLRVCLIILSSFTMIFLRLDRLRIKHNSQIIACKQKQRCG